MASKFVSKRNLEFLLYEVFDVLSLTQYPYYQQHNKKSFDLILDACLKMAKNLLFPIFEEMDRRPPELEDGRVRVHPAVRTIMKQFGEGGWIAAKFEERFDGEQLPYMIADCCQFVFAAANYSGVTFPGLTAKAARLITSFGSQAQIDTYVPPMLGGLWQGTMALTEPQAGSSLADITTTAVPLEGDTYRIRGQKIFISAGDHDGVDNVVHLMLAKIEGAPAGVKGISLFIVPQKRPDGKGGLVPNDITVSQIYHKMGYKGSPITELSIGEKDDCQGYLVGEPHKGLAYMFQMMNSARLGVGGGAAAIATAAYYAALEYARARPQGRLLTEKDPATPQVPLIAHADVRRMLLFQRSFVEGAHALLMQCCRYADLAIVLEGEEKERASLLLDLLTPVAKTYPSETSILSTSLAIQCLGGYGYCDDFPVEQYFRDTRIHPIHEGTTGVQGMDLLGRKVRMQNGKAFTLFVEEVQGAIAEGREHETTAPYAETLAGVVAELVEVTETLRARAAREGIAVYLSDATLYLEYFSLVAVAWQWLRQVAAAARGLAEQPSKSDSNFYNGKFFSARYFFRYELPKTKGLVTRLLDSDTVTLDMDPAFFQD
jgi:alkylation response protein AidB-like acyl-CoA dehydrogenase